MTRIVAAAYNRLFDVQQIQIELLEEIGCKREMWLSILAVAPMRQREREDKKSEQHIFQDPRRSIQWLDRVENPDSGAIAASRTMNFF
jgi:hypothetical protein